MISMICDRMNHYQNNMDSNLDANSNALMCMKKKKEKNKTSA